MLEAKEIKVVLLGGQGDSSWIVANALHQQFDLQAVLVESPPSRRQLVQRRGRRLGWRTVADQLALMPLTALQRARSRARIEEIISAAGLDRQRPAGMEVADVASVNDAEVPDRLRRLRPDVIVVNGTRIISKDVLGAAGAPFVNTHAGITPAYRGVHGGYWALANDDPAHCGVTVHLVDPGIDTGGILYQAPIRPTARDNFTTYPYLQLQAGVPLLVRAVVDLARGDARPVTNDLPSRLYSHPGLTGYLRTRVTRGVK